MWYVSGSYTVVLAMLIQKADIALEPLTTHPDEWAEPYANKTSQKPLRATFAVMQWSIKSKTELDM